MSTNQHLIQKNSISRHSAGERFALIAGMNEQIFHTADLGNLWGIRNAATLNITLARYVTQGLLYRIQKGLYSINKPTELNPYLLGIKACHGPAYISCETILFNNGIINQSPPYISIISQHSRRFTLAGQAFHSRQLADAFLFHDAGIEFKKGVRMASLARAVADTLYFNPKKHFDVLATISWNEVYELSSLIGYPLTIIQQYVDTQ